MSDLATLGKWLALMGIVLLATGGLLVLASKTFRGGKLVPGDIFIQKGNWSFFLPLATCLLISLILTLILQFTRWFKR